jgi:hypothetical protein
MTPYTRIQTHRLLQWRQDAEWHLDCHVSPLWGELHPLVLRANLRELALVNAELVALVEIAGKPSDALTARVEDLDDTLVEGRAVLSRHEDGLRRVHNDTNELGRRIHELEARVDQLTRIVRDLGIPT